MVTAPICQQRKISWINLRNAWYWQLALLTLVASRLAEQESEYRRWRRASKPQHEHGGYQSRLRVHMSHVDPRMESNSWWLIGVVLVAEQFQCVDTTFMNWLYKQELECVGDNSVTQLRQSAKSKTMKWGLSQVTFTKTSQFELISLDIFY